MALRVRESQARPNRARVRICPLPRIARRSFADDPQLWPPVITRTCTAPSITLARSTLQESLRRRGRMRSMALLHAGFQIFWMQRIEQQQTAGDGVVAQFSRRSTGRVLRFRRRSPSCGRDPLRARPSEAATAPCTRFFAGSPASDRIARSVFRVVEPVPEIRCRSPQASL